MGGREAGGAGGLPGSVPTRKELKECVRQASRKHHREPDKRQQGIFVKACERSRTGDVVAALNWRLDKTHHKPHKLWLALCLIEEVERECPHALRENKALVAQEVAAACLSQFWKVREENQRAFQKGANLLKRWKRLDAMMHVAEFLPALGADHERGLKKALNDLVGAGPAMKYDVDGRDKQAEEGAGAQGES